MIVRDFLDWVRTAPASERAEATSALARAYLYSDLSPDDLAAAEGAMLMLLDDPSPLVRRALADALAASPSAPPAIVMALAADQPQIAAPVLALSPLFVDADLVDAVATGGGAVQAAIASRAALPCSVAAAIAEVGTAESCLLLAENRDADIAPFSIGPHRRAATAIWPRSAKRCCCATILPRRRGRRWWPSCRRRWPVLSPRAMARRRSRPAHCARGLREGDGGARRGYADERRCAR